MNGPGFGGRGRMSANADKLSKEERSHVLLKMGMYLYRELPYLAIALVMMIVSSTLALIGPRLSSKAIGFIEKGALGQMTWDNALSQIKYYVVLMIVLYLLST